MKKFKVLLLAILLTPIMAGLYGILHDQFTYSISPEYYTRFKFYQFGVVNGDNGHEAIVPYMRLWVAYVGFMATWWVGAILGIFNGLVGLRQRDSKEMWKAVCTAVFITLAVTAVAGIVGLAYGHFYLSHTGVSWDLPVNLRDTRNFIAVGSMHNWGYTGSTIGAVIGLIYQVVKSKQ